MRTATLLAALLALTGMLLLSAPAIGQEDEGVECLPTEMGELTDIATASGSWADSECNQSQFFDNRPGKLFSFTLTQDAVVRIDLSASERDALLYLLDEDRMLIESDDDSGPAGDSRIERPLSAGTYLIEASAVGWSGRTGGTFEIEVRLVDGCQDVVDLGPLETSLHAEGTFSQLGCESQFRPDRSSQRYRFELTEPLRVQIDLTSELADPYLYLLDEDGLLLDRDDDRGGSFNSRIVRMLGVGSYILEATNWDDRDRKNLEDAPFEVKIIVAQNRHNIKVEAIDAPDRVVLGLPFDVHYRVGNLGDAPLLATDGSVQVRIVRPYVPGWRTDRIGVGDAERWRVGDSYHSGDSVAAFGSEPLPELHPFEGQFRWRTGPIELVLDVIVIDPDDELLSYHHLTRPILVLSGYEFEPVTVSVDDVEYRVSAIADETGEVTTSVVSAADAADSSSAADEATDESSEDAEPDEEGSTVDPDVSSRAIYTAGVLTQVLDGFDATVASLQASVASLYDLDGRGGLPLSDVSPPQAPTLAALLETLRSTHSETLVHAGWSPEQLQGVQMAETIVVRAGRAAARRIDQFARDWAGLTASDRVLSSDEALRVQAQLAMAAHVDAAIVEAALLVLAMRDAEDGWRDPAVAAARVAYARGIDCAPDPGALVVGDDVLRYVSLIYEHMLDRAYCGALAASREHRQLLFGLDLSVNPEIPEPEDAPPPAPQVAASRLLARVLEDGRIEFAIDLTNGERVLPTQRKLPADSPIDTWLRTSPVMHGGEELGHVYARRLEDGIVQATFVAAGADMSATARWIMRDDAHVDAWLISGALDPDMSGDDLAQRVADHAASASAAQLGEQLSLLAFVEESLQRGP